MNTIHSVSNTSLVRSSEAVAVRKSFSFRSFMMRVMLVIAIVVGGKVAWGAEQTITLTYSSFGLTTSYATKTATVKGYGFTVNQGYKGSGNVIQMNSSKGEGVLYNTTAIPGLKSITVNVSSGNKTYTIYQGNTQKPTGTSAGTGTTTSTISITGGCQYFALKVSGASYFSSIVITYDPTPHTVTFVATGSCDDTSLTEPSAGAGVVLPIANPPTDCATEYTFYGWTTADDVTETAAVPEIVGTNGETYKPSTDVTLYAVYKKIKDTPIEKTYNFSAISDFASWGTTYKEHIVDYDIATATFESANHQTGTITDIPVTKGNYVSFVLKDRDSRIKEVTFVCRQWPNKAQTITLNYSTNGGTSYLSTGTTSTNFTITKNNLNANTNAVKITFSSTSNQVGISSCTIKVTDVIYNSNPICASATVTYDANGATDGYVPEDNTAYPIGATVTVLGNTGNLSKYGYSFDGWNTAADESGDSYSAGSTFPITENTTLYAKWTPNDYYVTWWANGLALEGLDYTYGDYIPEDDIYDEDAEDYACEGKHFVGWSLTEFDETDDWPTMTTRDQIASTPVSGEKIYYAVYANVDANNAPLNTILWSETWNDGASEDTPNKYYADGHNGTIVYADAALTYTQTGATRLQNGTYAGGYIPELLIPNNGTWTISDIPTGGAYKMSLIFKSNRLEDEDFALTTTTDNVTISGTGLYRIITAADNVNSFDIIFRNESGNNARIDDVELRIIQIHGTGYTTFCPCDYGIESISNGDMVWAGKNGPTNNWNSKSNWVVYNDREYHLATSVPTESCNVFIINKSLECDINVKPLLTSDVTCNNITLSSNMGINLGEYDLTVTGNFTNDGSAISGDGSVIFAGTSAQAISGATTFDNVEFNNSNGITASTVPTINGTAIFTNGVINGNVIFGSGATVSDASASSHIDGVVTKSGAANGFTFPTGSNGNLGKVVVTDGTATNVSVQYFSNPAGFGTNDLPRWWNAADMSGENPFNHVSNVEYWKISSNEAITANFVAEASTDMHFNSETAEEDRIPANIQMAFYDNNRWTNVGGSASIDGNTLTITGAEIPASATRGISGNYTTFGSKSKSTVLPIELVSFTANCNGRSALIEWTTATEKNNDFFVLERSHDAVNFKEIARIAGAGNSIEPISYAYTDFGVRNGDNYYRLVQFDYDGTSTTSEIIVANCLGTDGEPEVLAYPNPFGDDLTLRFENFGNIQATVEVYDMLGRMVHTQKVNCSQNDYEVVLRLAGLSDGTYNVRISAKEFVLNKKVVKQ